MQMFIVYLVQGPKDPGDTEMKSSGPLRSSPSSEGDKEIKEYDRRQ